MSKHHIAPEKQPQAAVESVLRPLNETDMQDMCDACDLAIKDGGGFGWVNLPPRETMERYFEGVITIPNRILFVARLDETIAGAAILVCPPSQNEAQSHAVTLTGNFVAPWAREHGLSRMMIEHMEQFARSEGFRVVNLDVDETQKAAINLYESMGYEKFGENPYATYKQGSYLTAFYYTKLLDLQTV